MIALWPYLLTLAFAIPIVVIVVQVNIRYRQYLRSLSPEELEADRIEHRTWMQIW